MNEQEVQKIAVVLEAALTGLEVEQLLVALDEAHDQLYDAVAKRYQVRSPVASTLFLNRREAKGAS